MNILHMLLHKMIQMILYKILTQLLLQEDFINNINILANDLKSTNYGKATDLIWNISTISKYPHRTNIIKK